MDKYRKVLDISSIDLDGSHTPAMRGGEEVGYQGRKKRKTTNSLYLTDRQGIPIVMSSPKSDEHHDTHDIENVIGSMMDDLGLANIMTDGLFLNADAGFDSMALRNALEEKLKLLRQYNEVVEEIVTQRTTIEPTTEEIVEVGTSEFLANNKVHIGDTMYLIEDVTLKQMDNDAFEPRKLKREKVKEVLLSFRRDLQENARSECTESRLTTFDYV